MSSEQISNQFSKVEINDTESVSSVSSDEIDNQVDNLNLKGDSIGSYYIIDELGRGAFSIVWLAFHIVKKRFYAFKVNHPNDFSEAVSEAKFHKRLPNKFKNNDIIFNKIIESFPKTIDNKKYYCSVYRLYCGNLDDFISKGYYPNGYNEDSCIKMIYKVVKGLHYLHNKLHVFHGDLKPDNILIQGYNKRDKDFMLKYKKHPKYEKLINQNDDTAKKILHYEIVSDLNIDNDLKYDCEDIFINEPKSVLSDFGNFCDIEDEFEDEFGTRYYRAPEVIMVIETGYPVDIWALGCTMYEIVTGKQLFDPKKKDFDTNHEHLCMIERMCGKIPKKMVKQMSKSRRKKYFSKDCNITKNKKNNNNNDISPTLRQVLENDIERIDIINFIESCLKTVPSSRATIDELIQHSLFDSCRSE